MAGISVEKLNLNRAHLGRRLCSLRHVRVRDALNHVSREAEDLVAVMGEDVPVAVATVGVGLDLLGPAVLVGDPEWSHTVELSRNCARPSSAPSRLLSATDIPSISTRRGG